MSVLDIDELPKWQKVKYDIEVKIIIGEYEPGELVPSVRNLAKIYGIGTSTSHTILEKMSREGTLIMEQGIGFRVNEDKVGELKEKHINQIRELFGQACKYAERIQLDPIKIVKEIRGNRK